MPLARFAEGMDGDDDERASVMQSGIAAFASARRTDVGGNMAPLLLLHGPRPRGHIGSTKLQQSLTKASATDSTRHLLRI